MQFGGSQLPMPATDMDLGEEYVSCFMFYVKKYTYIIQVAGIFPNNLFTRSDATDLPTVTSIIGVLTLALILVLDLFIHKAKHH